MISYVCLAKWFGLVSLFLSLGILFNLEDAKAMARHMIKEESGYIMGGVLPIIFGSFMFVCIESYVDGWSILVAAVGTGMMLIGIFRVMFVKHWKNLLAHNAEKIPPMFALFGLMIAVMLLYVGFISPHFRFEI